MRILLTGASGLVGAACAARAASEGHEVIGVVGRSTLPVAGAAALLSRDLTDPRGAHELVMLVQPDVIINAAAVAEPAQCEADPVRAAAVNAHWPAALAQAARQAERRLIHLSTEQVFDGESGPYRPDSPTRPLNLYGEQKLAGEQQVLAADGGAAVVRLPLLFGNSPSGRRSVHEKMFEHWAAGRVMPLFVDEFRQICTAENVAAMLLRLAVRPDLRGIWHWAGARKVSRWEMGVAICRHLSVPEKWIRAQHRADMPEFTARRPRDLSLEVAPLDRELGLPCEAFDDAVRSLVRPRWAQDVAT